MEAAADRDPEQVRAEIGERLRALREARGFTQAKLARKLRLSQARLSNIERGTASLTAEQFLAVLSIFNVTAAHFGASAPDVHAELQNALARFGAVELFESDTFLPSERIEEVNALVRETLIVAAPRLVAGLGPVLVRNSNRLNLAKVHAELSRLGRASRLPWLAENVFTVLRRSPRINGLTASAQEHRRAIVVLESFVAAVPRPRASLAPDIFDDEILSRTTLERVQDERSAISRRWGIITALQPEDFRHAIEDFV